MPRFQGNDRTTALTAHQLRRFICIMAEVDQFERFSIRTGLRWVDTVEESCSDHVLIRR